MSSGEDDLDDIREERIRELRERQEAEAGAGPSEAEEAAQQQAEAQKQAVLRRYLSDGARQRLNSVRMSKPQFAEQVEQQVLALAQSGRLGGQIDEAQMKELLRELSPESRSFDIKRR